MVKIELETSTLATLIAGLYCTYSNVNPVAIPESIYLEVAEKLEFFLPVWDYSKISFEDWVKYCLMIYPKPMLSESEIEELQNETLYWERITGNVVLSVSMDIKEINNVE